MYWVYILGNRTNKVLYIGMTNDLAVRLYQHKNKLVDGFTSKYKVDRLLYYDQFNTGIEAIEAEKRLKGWTRKKKNSLVSSFNPDWNDLSFEF